MYPKPYAARAAAMVATIVVALLSIIVFPGASASANDDPPVCAYNQVIAGCKKQIVYVDELDVSNPDALIYRTVLPTPVGDRFAVCQANFNDHQTPCQLLGFVPDTGPDNPCDDGYLRYFDGELVCAFGDPPEQPPLAFTGAETSVLAYVGSALIAFGALALGTRRRIER